jgi:predicted GNAT superfamily acetyltransferase
LVRRNAFFNLVRLGAVPKDYLVNFYGSMSDAINTGDATDRLKVTWRLTDEQVVQACAQQREARASSALIADGASVVLDADSGATVRRHAATESGTVLVGVPSDIESLRRTDPELGQRWRLAVRDILGGLMTDGWAVTDFCSDGYYVLSQHEERQPQ